VGDPPADAVGDCYLVRPKPLPILGELLPLSYELALALMEARTLTPPVIAGRSVARGLL
jgi:hypothetical protein